jgi:hypothetical protein
MMTSSIISIAPFSVLISSFTVWWTVLTLESEASSNSEDQLLRRFSNCFAESFDSSKDLSWLLDRNREADMNEFKGIGLSE